MSIRGYNLQRIPISAILDCINWGVASGIILLYPRAIVDSSSS